MLFYGSKEQSCNLDIERQNYLENISFFRVYILVGFFFRYVPAMAPMGNPFVPKKDEGNCSFDKRMSFQNGVVKKTITKKSKMKFNK